jgi:hypothetical protein
MHPNPLGLAYSLSPVDLPEPQIPPPHPLRWATTVIVVAALVLTLSNAHAIRGWTYQLPPSPGSARAIVLAEGWYDAVGRLGLNWPVETLHDGWQSLKARRFQGEDQAEASASLNPRAYSSSASG